MFNIIIIILQKFLFFFLLFVFVCAVLCCAVLCCVVLCCVVLCCVVFVLCCVVLCCVVLCCVVLFVCLQTRHFKNEQFSRCTEIRKWAVSIKMQQHSKMSSFKMQQNYFQEDFQDATKVKMSNFKNHYFVLYLSLVGWLLVVFCFCLSTFNHYRNGEGAPHERREENAAQPKREERDRVKWCSIAGWCFLVCSFFQWCCLPPSCEWCCCLPSFEGLPFFFFLNFVCVPTHKMLNHHRKRRSEKAAPPKGGGRRHHTKGGRRRQHHPRAATGTPCRNCSFFNFYHWQLISIGSVWRVKTQIWKRQG